MKASRVVFVLAGMLPIVAILACAAIAHWAEYPVRTIVALCVGWTTVSLMIAVANNIEEFRIIIHDDDDDVGPSS